MIKLRRILFERIDGEEFVKVLRTVDDSMFANLIINSEQEFYDQNKATIDRILSAATEFKYLGSGAFGPAFSIGNKQVLKLGADNRPETVLKHFDKKRKKGKHLPMVYDSGRLTFDGEEIKYAVLENFETGFDQNDDYRWALDTILLNIDRNSLLSNPRTKKPPTTKEMKELVKELVKKSSRLQDIIPKMEEELRLGSDWLDRLISDAMDLHRKHILDAHSGNLGIRRTGAEGYFVFFD